MSYLNTAYWSFITLSFFLSIMVLFKDQRAKYLRTVFFPYQLILFTLMVTNREIFSDSLGYKDYFLSGNFLNSNDFGLGFNVYSWIFHLIGSWDFFLLSFPVLLVLSSLFLYKRLCNEKDYGVACYILLCWPFIWAYSTTGLRQSVAISICLFALNFVLKHKYLAFCITVALAISFHTSSLLIILTASLFFLNCSVHRYIKIWIASIIMAILPQTKALSSKLYSMINITSEYNNYFNDQYGDNASLGLRADFILFSAFPIIFFLASKYLCINYKANTKAEMILCAYLILNSFANIVSYIPYSDRIYAYSWVIAPILISCYWNGVPQYIKLIFVSLLIYFITVYSTHWLGF